MKGEPIAREPYAPPPLQIVQDDSHPASGGALGWLIGAFKLR